MGPAPHAGSRAGYGECSPAWACPVHLLKCLRGCHNAWDGLGRRCCRGHTAIATALYGCCCHLCCCCSDTHSKICRSKASNFSGHPKLKCGLPIPGKVE